MNSGDKKVILSPLIFAAIFVSIFKYRIAGSLPIVVGVGSLIISTGIVAVVSTLITELLDLHSELRRYTVLAGAVLISIPVYCLYFIFSPIAQRISMMYLVSLAVTVAVTFTIGNQRSASAADGLRHGFLTSGISSVLVLLLVIGVSLGQEVPHTGIISIASVVLPLLLGTVGGVLGAIGGVLSHRSPRVMG